MTEGGPTAIVCDDAPGFRALMTAMLSDAGLNVVGEAATWEDTERLAPGIDAILVDLCMPMSDLRRPQCHREGLPPAPEAAPAATLAVVTALSLPDAGARLASVDVALL